MIWCEKSIHFAGGITFIKSCSMSLGLSLRVSSRRREMRCTCVSTTTPTAFLNHVPSTTLAVLRATPGRSEEHTSELQSHLNLVCRLLLEKKKNLELIYSLKT